MRSLKILFAATLVWLEVGCGLPSPYFLAAPIPGTLAVGTTSTASFTNPGPLAGNNTTVAGFEVYYKFSASTPTGNDINLGGGGTPGPGSLQADGFFPLCLATDTPPISRTAPMISVSGADAASSFAVTVTINATATSTYSYTSPTQGPLTFNIGRYISFSSAPPYQPVVCTECNCCHPFARRPVDYTGSDADESLIPCAGQAPRI